VVAALGLFLFIIVIAGIVAVVLYVPLGLFVHISAVHVVSGCATVNVVVSVVDSVQELVDPGKVTDKV
jgi:predicted transcriptional regulator